MGSPKKAYVITFEAFRGHCKHLSASNRSKKGPRGLTVSTIERICDKRANQLTKEPYCRESNCPVVERLNRGR